MCFNCSPSNGTAYVKSTVQNTPHLIVNTFKLSFLIMWLRYLLWRLKADAFFAGMFNLGQQTLLIFDCFMSYVLYYSVGVFFFFLFFLTPIPSWWHITKNTTKIDGMVVQWLALWHHIKTVLGLGLAACSPCMLSLCLCGFSPNTVAHFHSW